MASGFLVISNVWFPRRHTACVQCARDMICRDHGGRRVPPALPGAECHPARQGQHRESHLLLPRPASWEWRVSGLLVGPSWGCPFLPAHPPKRPSWTLMVRTQAQSPLLLWGGRFLLSLRCGHGEDSSDGVKFRRPRGHTFHFPPVL